MEIKEKQRSVFFSLQTLFRLTAVIGPEGDDKNWVGMGMEHIGLCCQGRKLHQSFDGGDRRGRNI